MSALTLRQEEAAKDILAHPEEWGERYHNKYLKHVCKYLREQGKTWTEIYNGIMNTLGIAGVDTFYYVPEKKFANPLMCKLIYAVDHMPEVNREPTIIYQSDIDMLKNLGVTKQWIKEVCLITIYKLRKYKYKETKSFFPASSFYGYEWKMIRLSKRTDTMMSEVGDVLKQLGVLEVVTRVIKNPFPTSAEDETYQDTWYTWTLPEGSGTEYALVDIGNIEELFSQFDTTYCSECGAEFPYGSWLKSDCLCPRCRKRKYNRIAYRKDKKNGKDLSMDGRPNT